MKTVALIMAGGSGTRMRSDVAKQSLKIKGRKILRMTVEKFCNFDFIDNVVVVGRKQDLDEYRMELKDLDKILDIVEGGSTRSESVYNGLMRLRNEKPEIVAVHDAVRPFVDKDVVKRTVDEAQAHGGAVAAAECTDTVAMVDRGNLIKVPDRSGLRNLQTPQTFRFDILFKGHEKVRNEKLNVTDDTGAVMLVHDTIKVVESSLRNIKITNPEDLIKAEVLAGENG